MKHSANVFCAFVVIGLLSHTALASSDPVEVWTKASLTSESGWEIQATTTDHARRVSSFRVFFRGKEVAVPQTLFAPIPYPVLEKIRIMRSGGDNDYYIVVPGTIFDEQGNGTRANLLTLYFSNATFTKSHLETVPAEYLDGL